jgi:cytochrome b561
MQFVNTKWRYGAVAIALHWLVAVLMIGLIGLGIYMVQLPDAGFAGQKITLILLHKQIGILVWILGLARLAWRQFNPLPELAQTMPEWQQIAAVLMQLCLLGLMIVQPVLGWLMSSAAGISVSFFGLFTLPDFLPHNEIEFARLRGIHDGLGLILAAMIVLHAGAALRHHYVLHDDTLQKMLGLRKRSV